MLHRAWQCPCNVDHGAYAASDHLRVRACRGAEKWLAFWLRGLIPTAWLPSLPEVQATEYYSVGAYTPAGGFLPRDVGEPVFLFGDASGGKYGSHPSLRRVGVAVAQLAAFEVPFLKAAGPLDPEVTHACPF